MIHCQNCGRENDSNVNFCRFCGNSFVMPQAQPMTDATQVHSRPYMWKTDEYPLNPTPYQAAPTITQVEPIPSNQTRQMAYQQPSFITNGYRCPRCGSQNLPITKRQISTAGWIVFAVLLIFTGIFFWVGLLMKEDVRVCPVCNCKIG